VISTLTLRRLVTISAVTTLVSLGLMVAGMLFPLPLLLVLAMSLGQLFGTISLVLYLLAIALDLQGVGEHEVLVERGAKSDAADEAREGEKG
jgi:hypothetical protein